MSMHFLFYVLKRVWYDYVTSFWTMEMPPFIMTSFQSVYGQVVAWCVSIRVVRLTGTRVCTSIISSGEGGAI